VAEQSRRLDGPLREVLAYYRDLGVAELYLTAGETAARAAALNRGTDFGGPPGPPASSSEKVEPAGPVSARDKHAELLRLSAEVAGCRACGLCETRTQTVFADGTPRARIMFVGEAPGADEDAQGVPFVGRAGQLLTKMIEAGMGLSRADVYIANVLKCRPPGNRNPLPEEIASCRHFLEAQIELVSPAVLVALGKFAAQFLLGTEEGMMRMRGRWGSWRGIPVMPTYHPSFLLRQPERKKEAWEDLLKALAKAGLPPPRKRGEP
jgi:uracil-DNA glycosylase family 4